MSDLVILMEAHIREERHPSLIKFCDNYKDQVKSYTCNFENANVAKKNLQKKMKIAFADVRGKNKKRGPGAEIDLQQLYAEAKATAAITSAGWRTLSSPVENVQSSLLSQQNNYRASEDEDSGKGKEDVSEEKEDGSEEKDGSEERNVSEEEDGGNSSNDNELLSKFRSYKNKATIKSKNGGFYIDGDLHEILSLSDVLFIKENEYSDEQLSHFEVEDLGKLRKAVINQYTDSSIKFDTSLYNQISEVLRDFRANNKPRTMKERINEIAKNADDDDYRLIDILINSINKIPAFTRSADEEIGESELQGSYINLYKV